MRATVLAVPPTPLLTVELRLLGPTTAQGETNFVDTHGVNLKWFLHRRMESHYVFVGAAAVRDPLLREAGGYAAIPYAGYGYALRFARRGILDARLGVGPTVGADRFAVYPVLKVGVGLAF